MDVNISTYPDHAIRAGQYFLMQQELNQPYDSNVDENRPFAHINLSFSLRNCVLCERHPGIYDVFRELMKIGRTLAIDIYQIWSIQIRPSSQHHSCICKKCFLLIRCIRKKQMQKELTIVENDN